MVSTQQLQSKQEKICLVGLGYVGLPLAVLLAKHFSIIGFDVNAKRVAALKEAKDETREVSEDVLRGASIAYTTDPAEIKNAKFIIVAVPTPIDEYKQPDLFLVRKATETVGQHLEKGSIVVYESTVYPGVTEEICVPILEKTSGLTAGIDFWVGYSPERVNPGDQEHTIDKVVKVVSGMDAASADVVAGVYGAVTRVHRAPSIKVAEAAKVIENIQRDLNIAFMNELAMLFYKMHISIYDVLAAAGTKWNFLQFAPGLVGGHCIGVDPYYLTYKAQVVGHHPEIILAGRRINDTMHSFFAEHIIKTLQANNVDIKRARVGMFGITFKENVPDIRNSKIVELHKALKEFGVTPMITDPYANRDDVKHEYGIEVVDQNVLTDLDVLIVGVAHNEFTSLTPGQLRSYMKKDSRGIIFDVKHIYRKEEIEAAGLIYWSL